MGTEPGSVKTKSEKSKEKRARAPREPKVKLYRNITYQATPKVETEAGRKLLASETQSALVLRTVVKKSPSLAQLVESVAGQLPGKKKSTVLNNTRWYLAALHSEGYLRSVVTKSARA